MAVGKAPANPRAAQIGRLFEHLVWADAELAAAVSQPAAPADAIREYAHIAAVEEVWLSRIERRQAVVPIWPATGAVDAASLAVRTAASFRKMIDALDDPALDALVTYTNSAGKTFSTALGDLLIHVALHGQYHRGKVNQMLRQGGVEPAPVDFISFVRGAPAAVTPR
jgi:uncharacterized damage-inducible protein DinB